MMKRASYREWRLAAARARLLLPALIAALAGGCAPDPASDHRGVQRLALYSVGEREVPIPERRLVRRIAVPLDLSTWRMRGEGTRVMVQPIAKGEAEQPLLVLPPAPHRNILVPGTFEAGSFNRLEIRIRSAGELGLSAALMRGGRAVVDSGSRVKVYSSHGPQVVQLELPEAGCRGEPFDGLMIVARPATRPWILADIDLILDPQAGRPPTPEEGAGLIEIGEEARRGVGLFAGQDLAADFRVPTAGVLTCSLARPRPLRCGEGALAVEARVESAGARAIVQRLELPVGDEADPRWEILRVDLGPLAGRRARVRFRLESHGDPEGVCALAEPAVHAASSEPATVLLVTSDTHRGDHLSSADLGVRIDTPVLARLADRGLIFENCFSSANVTVPSHVVLMTATHPRDTGVLTNHTALTDRALTLAERFGEAGFLTWAVTSAMVLRDDVCGLGQGFDRLSAPEELQRDSRQSIDRLLGWLPDAEGRPLFAWLHVFDAHQPYSPPERLRGLYYPADRDPFDPGLPPADFPEPDNMPGLRDSEWARAQYKSEITYLDRQLGRILEAERFHGGIVALTADHGECLGDQGIWWNHAGLYPSTIHVPMILSFPGVEAGRRCEHPVRQIDLGRTLLDLAGLERTEFPGLNLVDQSAAARVQSRPRFALAANGYGASVTLGQWHLILHLGSGRRRDSWVSEEFRAPLHEVELYDLEADRHCLHDLSRSELERASGMRALLVEWLQGARGADVARAESRDPRLLEQLAQLGYATGRQVASPADLIDPQCPCVPCQRFRRERSRAASGADPRGQ